jgi:hypothetical protein
MAISNNLHDRDKAAYKENALDGGLDRRVTDVSSQDLLETINETLQTLEVNVGSVNALLVGINEYTYGESLGLAGGAEATLVSQFFVAQYKLRRVSCTGENIGVYTVYFNGVPVDKKRSTYTNFNCEFDYETGITIPANTTVEVKVENASSSVADFSAQILYSAL